MARGKLEPINGVNFLLVEDDTQYPDIKGAYIQSKDLVRGTTGDIYDFQIGPMEPDGKRYAFKVTPISVQTDSDS